MVRTEDAHEFIVWLWSQSWDIFEDRRRKYFCVGAGLDIETTNVIKRHRAKPNEKKGETVGKFIYDHVASYAYAFQITIGDHSLLTRTWENILYVIREMQRYGRKNGGSFFVWIANEGFEFQFFRRRLKIKSCFAKKSRQPLYFNIANIHFADALAITGGSLSHLSKNYTASQKKEGQLDYSVLRSWKSELSETEKDYCFTDTEILSEFFDYIKRTYIDTGLQIPYTQTGIIRAEVKAAAERAVGAKEFVHSAYPASRKEYDTMMQWLFRGGYTHACAVNANVIHHDVYGVDLTSSYPAVMLQCDNYPMSRFLPVEFECDGKEITDPLLQTHACTFVCDFWGIRNTTMHTVESRHKIVQHTNARFDNGRLVDADHIRVHLTELDYDIYKKFYTWDRMTVGSGKAAARGRLPKYLREPLLKWYLRKQQLKAAGLEDTPEYRIAKALVNAFYGLCVQRLRFLSPIYDPERQIWTETQKEKSYVTACKNSVLLPQWGIYVTANARHRILDMIYRIDGAPERRNDPHVVYCDTDSIYYIGDHKAAIAEYNAEITKLNRELPPECDDLGTFDKIKEGIFPRFKTIGAKRYIKERVNGKIIATVAGLNGEAYVKKFGDRAFENFNLDGFLIAAGESQKLTSIYIDEPTDDIIDGVPMHEESCVALTDIDFKLTIEPLKMYAKIIQIMMERMYCNE